MYKKPGQPVHAEDSPLNSVDETAPEAAFVSWKSLLERKETWALGLARLVSDPIWWFYLFWIPKFLHTNHGLTVPQIGPPLVVIYVAADVGSIAGGYLSSTLIRLGWSPVPARKGAMLVSAVAVTPMVFAAAVPNLWATVALVALATAAHQGWAANIFTIVADIYPKSAVASVVGLCGSFGSLGGVLFSVATGIILQRTGRYAPIFFLAGIAYLVALAIIHVATRKRVEPDAA